MAGDDPREPPRATAELDVEPGAPAVGEMGGGDGVGTAERRRRGRARDASSRAADWTWALLRRIHLGTRKPANWAQLFKFGVVGASGYVVNLTTFALLTEVGSVHHVIAAVAAFGVAVTNNFLWNRHWTFRATEGHPGFQAARFLIVSVCALGVNLVVLSLLVDVAGAPALPSQALAVAIAMPLNFIGNKLWTFG